MTPDPGSAGTTVTLFGDNDPLDHALGTQLEQRGCRTHLVSVPTGWLRTAAHAVMRLDTDAGAAALEQLVETPQPRSHIIAVCPEPADASESRRVREMCRDCGIHHDVSLIWHAPLEEGVTAPRGGSTGVQVATQALAASVADEMMGHSAVSRPSFVTRPFPAPADH